MTQLAPVVVFAYKRADKIKKCLRALEENILADKTRVYLYADGAKSDKDRSDVEETRKYHKKFVRYKEGAEKYSLGLTKFQELAKEANAVYKVDKIVLVNCEIFEKFLETFREY